MDERRNISDAEFREFFSGGDDNIGGITPCNGYTIIDLDSKFDGGQTERGCIPSTGQYSRLLSDAPGLVHRRDNIIVGEYHRVYPVPDFLLVSTFIVSCVDDVVRIGIRMAAHVLISFPRYPRFLFSRCVAVRCQPPHIGQQYTGLN
jgi:hypothetical protein